YVADLVGIGMVRELAAMMTAILMSGRTGAAFAANLGTMQVSDEISALQTLGIPPMEFLVLPRIVALVMMMPLLAVFANIGGMLGGLLIGGVTLDISPVAYYNQTSGDIRCDRRGRRLLARHAVLAQRSCCRRRRHLRRRALHRVDHSGRCDRHSTLHDSEHMSAGGASSLERSENETGA